MGDVLDDIKSLKEPDEEEGSIWDRWKPKSIYGGESGGDSGETSDSLSDGPGTGKNDGGFEGEEKSAEEDADEKDRRGKMFIILLALFLLLLGGLIFWRFSGSAPDESPTPTALASLDKYSVFVTVQDSAGAPISGALARLDIFETATILSANTSKVGVAKFQISVPANATSSIPKIASVSASKGGFSPGLATAEFSNKTAKLTIILDKAEVNLQPATVFITAHVTYNNQSVPATVVIYGDYGNEISRSQSDPDTGNARFEVDRGQTVSARAFDAQGRNGNAPAISAYDGAVLEIALVEIPTDSRMTVNVTDAKTGGPIGGAELTGLDSLDGIATIASTGPDGTAVLSTVGLFRVLAYEDGYLPNSTSAKTGAVSITLAKVAPENSVSISIRAANMGAPVGGASVQVRGSSMEFLGYPAKLTDILGLAHFSVARNTSIAALGSWNGIDATSGLPKVPAEGMLYQIDFSANATVTVIYNITNRSGAPISGAFVRTLLQANYTQVSSCTTGTNALCSSAVAPGSAYYATANASGFLPYTASVFTPPSTDDFSVPIMLERITSNNLSSRFLGLFDSHGQAANVASENGSYYAKFSVSSISTGDAYGKVFYARLGSQCYLSSEAASIGLPVYAPDGAQGSMHGTVRQSGSCTQGGNTTGSSDWAAIIFPQSQNATSELSIPIATRQLPTGAMQADYPLAFAFAKYNQSAQFSSFEDGANLGAAQITVSRTPGSCTGSLCIGAAIFDAQGNKVSSLVEAAQGQVFAWGNASSATSVVFESSAVGFEGSNAQSATVNISPGSFIVSKKFTSSKRGLDWPMTITARDASGTALMHATIYFDVTGPGNMSVAQAPARITAGKPTTVWANVTNATGAAIAKANAVFSSCAGSPIAASVIASEYSTGSGNYSTSLYPSSEGKIGLAIRHPDYRPYDSCSIISSGKIFAVDPSLLNFTKQPAPQPFITATDISGAGANLIASAECDGDAQVNVTPQVSVLSSGGTSTFRISTPAGADYPGINTCYVFLHGESLGISQDESVGVVFNGSIPLPTQCNDTDCGPGKVCHNGTCYPTSDSCIDTDGGRNYSVRGAIHSFGVPVPGEADTCRNERSLIEWYCDGTVARNETYACPVLCSNGACQEAVAGCPGGDICSIAQLPSDVTVFVFRSNSSGVFNLGTSIPNNAIQFTDPNIVPDTGVLVPDFKWNPPVVSPAIHIVFNFSICSMDGDPVDMLITFMNISKLSQQQNMTIHFDLEPKPTPVPTSPPGGGPSGGTVCGWDASVVPSACISAVSGRCGSNPCLNWGNSKDFCCMTASCVGSGKPSIQQASCCLDKSCH